LTEQIKYKMLELYAGICWNLVPEPEMDFNEKRPFKVIYLNVTEEPLRVYIAQYNKKV